ncbi:hypothetical protein ACQJBY_005870 [Aegilops geniculata]
MDTAMILFGANDISMLDRERVSARPVDDHEAKFVAQCHENQGTGDLCFTKGFSAAIQGQCVDGDGNNEVAARGSIATGEDVYRQQQHPLSHQQLCHNSTRELKQY